MCNLPAPLPEAASITGTLVTPLDDTIVWDYLFRDHTFALSQPRTVSQVVDHCYRHIHRRLTSMGIVVFKIGVAVDPGDRFNNPSFGYTHEGYMFMDVLWRGAPRDCALLEDTLIQLFKTQSGCRNVNPGGGVSTQTTCSTSLFCTSSLHLAATALVSWLLSGSATMWGEVPLCLRQAGGITPARSHTLDTRWVSGLLLYQKSANAPSGSADAGRD